MRSVLVVALLVAVCSAAFADIPAHVALIQNSLNKLAVDARDSATCVAKATEIATKMGTCASSFPNLASTEAALNAFCNSTTNECGIMAFATLLQELVVACTDGVITIPDTFIDTLAQLNSLSKMACLQDNGEYCLLSMAELATQSISTDDSAALDVVCSGCVYKWWNYVNTYGNDLTFKVSDAFDLAYVCMKDNGKYCMLELEKLEDAYTHQDYTTLANVACETQCIARMAAAAAKYDPDFSIAIQVLCYRDPQQNLCLPKIVNAVYVANLTSLCIPDNQGVFSDACLAAIQNVLTDIGCCFVGVYNAMPTFADQIKKLLADNHIAVPDACPSDKNVVFTQVLENILKDWVNDNTEELLAALISDLALNLGVDPHNITAWFDKASLKSRAPSGVTAILEVSTISTTGATIMQNSVNNMIENDQYTLYSTAKAVPASARDDITAGVSVNTQDSKADLANPSNDAGHLAAGLAVLLVAFALA